MAQTNSSLRQIINRHMNALADVLNISFEDKSREVFRRMENEILQWERSINEDMPIRQEVAVWNALTSYQRCLLDLAQNKYGTSVMEWEEEKLREARELEHEGYIRMVHPARYTDRYLCCYITIEGRKLLKANEVKA